MTDAVLEEVGRRQARPLAALYAVVDGLKGFPDATNAVFPQTQIQSCIVHLHR